MQHLTDMAGMDVQHITNMAGMDMQHMAGMIMQHITNMAGMSAAGGVPGLQKRAQLQGCPQLHTCA